MNETKIKKFLVAVVDDEKRMRICELLQKANDPALIIQAKDGHEADIKLANALPHVVLLETNLPRVTGLKIAEWLILSKKEERVGIILISAIPEKEHFVDEVIANRVQFLEDPLNEAKLNETVKRAFDFSAGVQRPDVEPKKVEVGEILIREGEKGESVYLLIKGKLVAYQTRDGHDNELGHIGAGEFVGEMAFINGEPRSANVKALETSELIEIPNDLMDQILFKKPQWMKALMKTLSLRIKAANAFKG